MPSPAQMNAETNVPKITAPDDQKPPVLPDRRLRLALIVIAAYALIQVIRILAFQLAQDVLAGRESIAWLYPAYVDMFVGITAPFVAFAIWRRTGLVVWTTAIVWFTISIVDHLDAVTVALNATGPLPHSLPGGSQSGVVISLLVGVMLEGIILVSLTRAKLKSHYLGSPRSAE